MAAIPNSIGIPALAIKKMIMLSSFRSINKKSIEFNKENQLYGVKTATVQFSLLPLAQKILTSKV